MSDVVTGTSRLDRYACEDGAFRGMQIVKDAVEYQIYAWVVTNPGSYSKIRDWEKVVWLILGTEDTTWIGQAPKSFSKVSSLLLILRGRIRSPSSVPCLSVGQQPRRAGLAATRERTALQALQATMPISQVAHGTPNPPWGLSC
jgi:hypothetical protein